MCTNLSSVVHKYTYIQIQILSQKQGWAQTNVHTMTKKGIFSETGDVCSSSIFALASATSHQSCGNCTLGVTQQMNQNLREAPSNCTSVGLSVLCFGSSQNMSYKLIRNIRNKTWSSSSKWFDDLPPSRSWWWSRKIAANARSYVDLFSDLSNYLILALQVLK